MSEAYYSRLLLVSVWMDERKLKNRPSVCKLQKFFHWVPRSLLAIIKSREVSDWNEKWENGQPSHRKVVSSMTGYVHSSFIILPSSRDLGFRTNGLKMQITYNLDGWVWVWFAAAYWFTKSWWNKDTVANPFTLWAISTSVHW